MERFCTDWQTGPTGHKTTCRLITNQKNKHSKTWADGGMELDFFAREPDRLHLCVFGGTVMAVPADHFPISFSKMGCWDLIVFLALRGRHVSEVVIFEISLLGSAVDYIWGQWRKMPKCAFFSPRFVCLSCWSCLMGLRKAGVCF